MKVLVPGPRAKVAIVLLILALVADFDDLALAIAYDACLAARGHGEFIMLLFVGFFGEKC